MASVGLVGGGGVSVRSLCDALTSTHQITVQGCQNQQYWAKDQQEEGSTETQRSRHVGGEIIMLHPALIQSVSDIVALSYCCSHALGWR